MTALGDYVRAAREAQGLTLQALAREIGYRNLDKGARRLERLERTGQDAPPLLRRATAALHLDPLRVAELVARDQAERESAFERWARESQPMVLLRLVAGVAVQVALPEAATEPEAIDFAVRLARAQHARLCLVVDRRRSLWVAPDGTQTLTEATPDAPSFPYTTIG